MDDWSIEGEMLGTNGNNKAKARVGGEGQAKGKGTVALEFFVKKLKNVPTVKKSKGRRRRTAAEVPFWYGLKTANNAEKVEAMSKTESNASRK
jgi:hypothetical protein